MQGEKSKYKCPVCGSEDVVVISSGLCLVYICNHCKFMWQNCGSEVPLD